MITKPCKLQDPIEVQKLVDSYFTDRENEKEVLSLKNGDKRIYKSPPTMIGLASKLGIDRRTLQDYISEESDSIEAYNKEIVLILRNAKDRIIEELIDGVSKGYWTEKICLAMLTRYGEIGNDEEDKTVRIIMQGSNDWSK